ncbi:hypothetical protein AAG906_013165 [Vitis piasezkii]
MATEINFVQPKIPKLDGHYDHWCMLMENFMRSKEYWNLIEQGIPTTEARAELTEGQKRVIEDAKLKNLKVKNYLFQAIDRSDSLKQKYQGTAWVQCAQQQALRKEFEMLNIKLGEFVNEVHGEKMEDVMVIEKILRSMTPKFDYIVCSIEKSNDLDTLSIDVLQSSLLVYEQCMNGHFVEE